MFCNLIENFGSVALQKKICYSSSDTLHNPILISVNKKEFFAVKFFTVNARFWKEFCGILTGLDSCRILNRILVGLFSPYLPIGSCRILNRILEGLSQYLPIDSCRILNRIFEGLSQYLPIGSCKILNRILLGLSQ